MEKAVSVISSHCRHEFQRLFQNSVKTCQLNTSKTDEFALLSNNLSEEGAENIRKWVIDVCLLLLNKEPTFRSVFLNNLNAISLSNQTSNKATDAFESLFQLVELKMIDLINFIGTDGLIPSLVFCIGTKNSILQEIWTKNVERVFIQEKENLKNKKECPKQETCFPFSNIEFIRLKSLRKMQSRSESLILQERVKFKITEKFLETSAFNTVEPRLSNWNLEQRCPYVSDLIFLSLKEKTAYSISAITVFRFVEMLFLPFLNELLSWLIFDSDLLHNVILFLHCFSLIFGAQFEKEFENVFGKLKDRGLEFLKEFVENLVDELLRQTTEQTFRRSYLIGFEKHRHWLIEMSHILESQLDIDFFWLSRMKFWIDLADTVQNFVDSTIFFERLTKDHTFEEHECIDNLHNFTFLINALKLTLEKMNTSNVKLCMENIHRLEVRYFEHLLGENFHDEIAQIRIFDAVLQRIEAQTDFHLFSGKLIALFMKKFKIRKMFKKFCEGKIITDSETSLKYEWLSPALALYNTRVPYLIICELVIKNRGICDSIYGIKLTSEIVEMFFNDYQNNFDQKFSSFKQLFTMTGVLIVMIAYSAELKLKKATFLFDLIKKFINHKTPKAKALQIFSIKCLFDKSDKENVSVFLESLQQFKENWIRTLLESETPSRLQIFVPSNYVDFYQKLEDCFAIFEQNSSLSVKKMLDLVANSPKTGFLFTFYVFFIFKCSSNFVFFDLIRGELMKKVKENKSRFVSLLGIVGYIFIKRLVNNFSEKSIFKSTKSSNEATINKNANILIVFSAVLSQRTESNFLSHLMSFPGNELTSLVEQLSKQFLLGMALNDSSNYTNLLEMLMLNRKGNIYKCSEQCAFYFDYEKLQQMGRPEEGLFCPLDQKQISASKTSKLYFYHITYDREAAELALKKEIDFSISKYNIGHIEKHNPQEKSINFSQNGLKTTNILNLITNCIILVLFNLKTDWDLNFDCLFSTENIQNKLSARISANLEVFHSKSISLDLQLRSFLLFMTENLFQIEEIKNQSDYFSFHKNFQIEIMEPFEEKMTQICSSQSTVNALFLKKHPNQSALRSLICETNEHCFAKYPVLAHFLIIKSNVIFQDFEQKFILLSSQEKEKYFCTEYFIKNKPQLSRIEVVSKLIDFLMIFAQKYDSIISISQFRTAKIRDFTSSNPEINQKYIDFCESWNRLIDMNLMPYISKIIPKRLSDLSLLSCIILTNLSQSEKSDSIFPFILKILESQNEFIEVVQKKHAGQFFIFRNKINKNHFGREKNHLLLNSLIFYEKKINESCLIYSCKYGDLGRTSIDFITFEKFLIQEVNQLRILKESSEFLPELNFSFHTFEIGYFLRLLLEKNTQVELSEEQTTEFKQKLGNKKFKTKKMNSSLMILQQYVLPLSFLIDEFNQNEKLIHFVESHLECANHVPLTENDLLLELKLCNIYSFVELLELELYFYNFQLLQNIDALSKSENTSKQIKNSGEFISEIKKKDIYSRNSVSIINALKRLHFRAHFGLEMASKSLKDGLADISLWSIDSIPEIESMGAILMDFSIKDILHLIHAFLNN